MKRLIIAPHVDDDVLGCGGILDETCVVFYCGVDDMHVVSREERLAEAVSVAQRTTHHFWWPDPQSEYGIDERRPLRIMYGISADRPYASYACVRVVNSFALEMLIRDIEAVISSELPDEVYIPERSSYNQDHRAVYDAAMVALRPHDTLPFVKRVLAYEQPHVALWPIAQTSWANYYREIDVEEKITRYELMASQVRDHRSVETVAALAKLRGAAARVDWAEAFRVVRWVE